MNLITVIILSSVSIVGLQETVDALLKTFTGQDLVYYWNAWNRPKWLKPFIFCAHCMASVWGSIFFWIYQTSIGVDFPLIVWIPSLFAIALLNILISENVS